jgi:hypothetical protein
MGRHNADEGRVDSSLKSAGDRPSAWCWRPAHHDVAGRLEAVDNALSHRGERGSAALRLRGLMDALARSATRRAPIEGEHELFGFLTTDANAVVGPIHPKAMPVILQSAEEADRWLEADTADALAPQKPLPDSVPGSLPRARRRTEQRSRSEGPRRPGGVSVHSSRQTATIGSLSWRLKSRPWI